MNRWTSPQLDSIAEQIRSDTELKYAVALLKTKFVQSVEALIHADLHTGSIMVSGMVLITHHDSPISTCVVHVLSGCIAVNHSPRQPAV